VKIFGWAADDAGPGWYRLRVPFAELNRHGHDAHVATTMPDWVVEEADVVVGQRVCQPGATERWTRLAAGYYGRRPLMVFELDDDLWDIDPANIPAWNFYRRSPELLDNLATCARLADVCTVTTEALADVVRRINPNVMILPNQLPVSAFGKRTPVIPGWFPFTVGWAGGASHRADMLEALPGVRQFFKRHPEAEFHNVGTVFDEVRRSAMGAGTNFRSTQWIADVEMYYRALDFHVGLAPLRPSPFNRSKSEIKFLEYGARGIVTVASNTGPYERAIRPGVDGWLVDRPHEWAGILGELYRDSEGRLDMAQSALEVAESRSITKHWQKWEALYLN
jgi:glycosyltransferase involved in cell wall biosynthesis